MKNPDKLKFSQLHKELYDKILWSMTPRGKKPRKEWEAFHLLEFATFIRNLNWSREKKRHLEKILDDKNIGFPHLQKRTCDGYQDWKSEAIFRSLSEAQRIPKLACFLKFLEFCRDHEPDPLPLSVFNGRKTSPENIDELINDIKTHIEAQKQEYKNPDQPHLTVPESKEGNPNYYANAVMDVIGRDIEKQRLEGFLNCDMNVAWLQLAGVAGQGKSRLAFDLVNLAIDDLGWSAGFLEENGIRRFKDKWLTWQPEKPHLIVFDYVIGREDHIKPILQDLSEREDDLQQNIRILLIERQRWDNFIDSNNDDAGLNVPGIYERKAEWYLNLCQDNIHDGNDPVLNKSRFTDGIEELSDLGSNHLVNIVEQIVEREAGKALNISASEIKETLHHIDKSGRPLYAYFLGQEIANGEQTKAWSNTDLLRAALARERNNWWAAAFNDRSKPPRTEDDFPASRLAILATMTGGLDCMDAYEKKLISVPTADDREQALALTGNPMSEDVDGSPPMDIPSMQPDLLGEWYVIVSLEKPWSPLKELSDIAWRYAPEKMGRFMQHLVQDFENHPVVSSMLDCVDLEQIDKQYLSGFAVSLFMHFYWKGGHFNIPDKVIKALHIGADSGDTLSKHFLGMCFLSGLGVKQDHQTAIEYYKKAVQEGDTGAMVHLGGFYNSGVGVEKNVYKAVTLYKTACEEGNADAMVRLGHSYENEMGVERDFLRAFDCYKKATDLGNETAKLYLDSYRFAINMLDADGDERIFLSTLNDKSNNYNLSDPWPDIPLLIGDWTAPSFDGAFWIIFNFYRALIFQLSSGERIISELTQCICNRIRWVSLVFYPGRYLVDIEFYFPGKNETHYCSVIIENNGVGILEGRSIQIYGLNGTRLLFSDDSSPSDYLRFFCEFTYGDKGPFHIVSLEELVFITKPGEILPKEVFDSFIPFRHVEGEFSKEGWQRFEACFLYGDALYVSKFRLFPNGKVDMESDTPIAWNLPILRRTYDGIFRSRLR